VLNIPPSWFLEYTLLQKVSLIWINKKEFS